MGERHGFSERCFVGDVSLEAQALGTGFRDKFSGLFRGFEITINGKNARALLSESDRSRAPVAHALSRALTGTDDDCGFAFKAHGWCPLKIVVRMY